MYQLVDTSFEIDGKTILSPTNLTFAQGEITTLLGHNGCGKSTLIKLLSRQNAPSHGEVLFQKTPVSSYSHLEFAHQVAYLPQHPPVTDGVTVRELVCFGRYPWKGAFGRYSQQDYAIVESAIEKVGLSDLAERYVATLSGGERQRAWVAMLLAQQSQCILLDEPTSALDRSIQIQVINLLKDIQEKYELTYLFISHDLKVIRSMSDFIFVMKNGKIVEYGPSNEVFSQPKQEYTKKLLSAALRYASE